MSTGGFSASVCGLDELQFLSIARHSCSFKHSEKPCRPIYIRKNSYFKHLANTAVARSTSSQQCHRPMGWNASVLARQVHLRRSQHVIPTYEHYMSCSDRFSCNIVSISSRIWWQKPHSTHLSAACRVLVAYITPASLCSGQLIVSHTVWPVCSALAGKWTQGQHSWINNREAGQSQSMD